jgi:hypothetical protein
LRSPQRVHRSRRETVSSGVFMSSWCVLANSRDGASFGPEALKAVGQAFDKAWLEIAGNFGDDPGDIARLPSPRAGTNRS